MAYDSRSLLDAVGWRVLEILQEDGRVSMAELGRRVHLSAPAVAERVRRMEEAGIIAGYRAEVRPEKVGLPVVALLRLGISGDSGARTAALIGELPEVLECHHVTGEDCFVMKVAASSVSHLEEVIGSLSPYGRLVTSMVLSSPVTGRGVSSPSAEDTDA